MKSRALPLLALMTFCLLSLSLYETGCQNTNRTLDPTGVYAGDMVLWSADGVILDASRVFDEVSALATRNPAAVAAQPKLKALVDKLATQRKTWLGNALKARDAYAASKSGVDLKTLEGQLTFLRNLLDEARGVLAIN